MKNRIDCAETRSFPGYGTNKPLVRQEKTSPLPLPREQALDRGVDRLCDLDLVQLIIGSGTQARNVQTLARDVLAVLDQHAGMPEGAAAPTASLMAISGIGTAKALKLSACFELARRFSGRGGIRIRSPKDLVPYLMHWSDRPQENFLLATLNGAHELITVRRLTTGTLNRTLVHPREVFSEAVTDRAAAIIVAHNHPSGNLEISQDDENVTRRLHSAGELLGIHLLDHVIFAPGAWVSLAEAGKLAV